MTTPTGSQLQIGARFGRRPQASGSAVIPFFVPGEDFIYFRRAKSASGFNAKRVRVRNENQDPSRQMIPGVNITAKLDAMKFDLMPDVDSMVPFRAHFNKAFSIGAQLGATVGTPGTITTDGDTSIVGVGTTFTTVLAVGDWISIQGEPVPLRVTAIGSNTTLTTATAATTSAAGLTWKHASVPVFPWSFHPKTPIEADNAEYLDMMDYEITDGSWPVLDLSCVQGDIEIKIANGKITEVSEGWMGCYDTFASEAAQIISAATYLTRPALIGHFSTANAALLPLRIRISDAASAGNNGKFKAGFQRTVTGTLETDGTDTVEGTGTAFLTELVVGDYVYIQGEPAPLIVESITDNDTVVFTTGATTTASGLTATVVTYAGTAIPLVYDTAAQVTVAGARIGVSAFEKVWVIFPATTAEDETAGTLSVGDEWSFTEPRTLATPVFSNRDVLHSAGVQILIDDVPYGGVPGFPGFHDLTIKLMDPRASNDTTGTKYTEGIQPSGRVSATISFNRDRTDRAFLDKLIQASSVSIVVNMYGNPFGDTGYDELWRLTFATCEIADNQRDVSTENVLPEKIDVNATRGPSRTLTGTVTTNGTTTITGAGTLFMSQLFEGDEVLITGEGVRIVDTIASDTSLTLVTAAATSGAGKSVTAVSPIWSERILSTRATLTAAMA